MRRCMLILVLRSLFVGTAHAQLSGHYLIGPSGSYSTLAEAFLDLNSYGVSGPVVFDVPTGYTEVMVNQALFTTSPTATNTVTVRRFGPAPNPCLIAGTGTGNYDGVIEFRGTDYVTFDGIDIAEDTLAHLSSTSLMEWGYGIFMAGLTNASHHITIKNCTITLKWRYVNSLSYTNGAGAGILVRNASGSTSSSLTPSSSAGVISDCKFYGNTIRNCLYGISITGSNNPSWYSTNMAVGSSGANIITGFGGNSVRGAGIYAAYQQNLTVENNDISNLAQPASGDIYGIMVETGGGSNLGIRNNIIQVSTRSVTSALAGIRTSMSGAGTGNLVEIANNVVLHCRAGASTDAAGISHSGAPAQLNILTNTVLDSDVEMTGSLWGIRVAGGADIDSCRVKDNRISGLRILGPEGNLTGMAVEAGAVTVSGNLVEDLAISSASGATSTVVMLSMNSASMGYGVCADNLLHGARVLGTSTYQTHVIRGMDIGGSTSAHLTLARNFVDSLHVAVSGSGTVTGLLLANSDSALVTRNRITRCMANGTTSTVRGLHITGGRGNGIAHTMIGGLYANTSNSFFALGGIVLEGGITNRLVHNTVVLNGSSSGSLFGSQALRYTTTFGLELHNTVLLNTSVPGASGATVVLYCNGTGLSNYVTSSDHNNFHAGTPSPTRLLYSDGTNSAQTLAELRTRLSPREVHSFTEQTAVWDSDTDQHLASGVRTRCESGGGSLMLASDGEDIDGMPRYGWPGYGGGGSAPDVGADEGEFLGRDITPPVFVVTGIDSIGLGAISCPLAGVSITDSSSVNVTAGHAPRVYFRKTTNGNVLNDNTAGTDGWKWTETSSGASPFSFVIDHAKLYGGWPRMGDTIEYVVVAEDLAWDPHVGSSTGSFALPATSVALQAAQFPATGPWHRYVIRGPLRGTHTVGAGRTWASLGAALDTLNLLGNNGPLIFEVDAGHSEVLVNKALTTTTPTATNTVIVRKSGVGENPKLIAGAGTGSYDGVIEFRGTDYVTFDGIDVVDDTIAHTSTNSRMEWGYGIFAQSPTEASHHITIRNARITLKWSYSNASASVSGILINKTNGTNETWIYPSSVAGSHSGCRIEGNRIVNAYHGIVADGTSQPSAYDTDLVIGGELPNVITGWGGGSVVDAHGIKVRSQNEITIRNNEVDKRTQPSGSHSYGISALLCQSQTIVGNTIRIGANADYVYGIYVQTSDSLAVVRIDSNTVRDCKNSGVNADYFTAIESSSTRDTRISGNRVIADTLESTWTLTGIRNLNSTTVPTEISGNLMDSLFVTGQYGRIYGIDINDGPVAITGNTLHAFRIPNNTMYISTIYGCLVSDPVRQVTITDNTLSDFRVTGPSTADGQLAGLYLAMDATDSAVIARNVISGLRYERPNTTMDQIAGIYVAAGRYRIADNRIHDLSASGSAARASGVYVYGSDHARIANNMISDLHSTLSVDGIYLLGGALDSFRVFHNTVYLDAVGSYSTGINVSGYGSVIPNVALMNNNIVNRSTPNGSRSVFALKFIANDMTNYATVSDNNNLYAGIPSTTNCIAAVGGTGYRTLADFQTLVATRDQHSISEQAPLVHTGTKPCDLHLSASVATLCESGGKAIPDSDAEQDLDGDPRQGSPGYTGTGTAPDIGADEIDGGRPVSLVFTYIPVTPRPETESQRPLSVQIDCPAGLRTAPGEAPRVYFKRTRDANTYVDNTNATPGWKWMESGTGASPFQFTLDHALLYGGGGGGDTIQYFVIASSNTSPPTVKADAGILTQQPSSVQLSAVHFPTQGTLSSYYVGRAFSGTVTVGTGGTWPTVKSFFDEVNLGILTGDVTATIVGDCAEGAEPVLHAFEEEPPGAGYVLRMQPSGGAMRTISRTVADREAVLRLDDADRVEIDGLNTGGNGLTVTTLNTTANRPAAIMLTGSTPGHGCRRITIRNLTVRGGGNSTSLFSSGIYLGGSSQGNPGHDHDSILIENNIILRAAIGVYAEAALPSFLTNITIAGNTLGASATADQLSVAGIECKRIAYAVFRNNDIGYISSTLDPSGVLVGLKSIHITVAEYHLHNIMSTGTNALGGKGITVATDTTPCAVILRNNRIHSLGGKVLIYGILLDNNQGGITVVHNSVKLSGTFSSSATSSAISGGLGIYSPISDLDIRFNIFANSLENTSGVSKAYGIYCTAAKTSFTSLDGNVYHATGPEGILGYLGAMSYPTLSGWRAVVTPHDSGSTDLDPRFVSNTDLNIQSASGSDPISGASNRGIPLALVPEDCFGNPRSIHTPDAGAIEFISQHRSFSTPGTLTESGIDNLTLTGPGTWTLGTNLSLAGTLTLDNALLDPGPWVLTLGPTASIGGTPGATSMILGTGGQVRKIYDGPGSFTFPVGDNIGSADYTPVTLSFTSGTFTSPAWAGVTLTVAKHPSNPSLSNYLTRYWTLGASGVTAFTADVACTYADGDVVGEEAVLFGGKFDTHWITGGAVNAAENRIGFAGLTGFSAFTGMTEQAASARISVRVKAWLQGCWTGAAMSAGLNSTDSTLVLLPLVQPYSDPLVWNYPGAENVAGAGFFSAHPTIVDWVLVELRTGNPAVPPMTVVERRAAFMRSDGMVVDMDGVSPVSFATADPGSYFVVLRHRNHLAVMSASVRPLSLGSTIFDFTQSGSSYGADSQRAVASGVSALVAGDATGDGFIDLNDFTDADNNTSMYGYVIFDANLDGFIDLNDFTDADNNTSFMTQVP